MNDLVRIGDNVTRVEDIRFLTGQGHYIDDLRLAGGVHVAFLRSPIAYGTITELDVGAARSAPGVVLVLTGKEWVDAGHGPIPTKNPVRKFRDGRPFNEPVHHCLAVDAVYHAGQPIVMVAAQTRQQALDAVELIHVDFDERVPVVEQKQAMANGAPRIYEAIPNNIAVDFELGNRAEVEAALASADHVVTLEMRNNRVTAVPMEPRGCAASYDAESGVITLWNSSQNIHANRDVFAEQILKIAKDKLRHVAPDVGGGFGAKNSLYAEPPLVAWAAKTLGRPVSWVADRSEAMLTDTHGRDQVSTVSLALDKDGTFKALKVHTIGNVGAWCGTMGPFTPTNGSARTQGGPYAFPAMLYEAEAVFTNTSQTDPYRGAGRPEASFHIERIIDYAAAELGMDPIELRRRNMIRPDQLPWTTPMGLMIDSGNFPELLDITLRETDFDGFGARAAKSRADGKLRGYALAPYLECTGGQATEEARISVNHDGTLQLAVGSHSTGMSHETVHAQVLADRIGVPLEMIRFRQADTDATTIGGGHGGSRGMEVGGNAVKQAAEAFAEKLKAVAAHALNSTPADIALADGMARDTRTGQSVAVSDLLTAAKDQARLPPALVQDGLSVREVYERTKITVPNGVHAAEVEVDPETGIVTVVSFWAIDDFGKILNPLLADGQVMGGVAQGIGQALYEEVVYDAESGQLLTGSLMDYCMPRADDLPALNVVYYEDAPTTHNPLGVKGAGEAGCCGAPPAVVNAVMNALKAYGVKHIDMPLTPEKVWRAINGV